MKADLSCTTASFGAIHDGAHDDTANIANAFAAATAGQTSVRPYHVVGTWNRGKTPGKVPAGVYRRKLRTGYRLRSTAVLGGLHHEYLSGRGSCMIVD